jgi:hypothetical protein
MNSELELIKQTAKLMAEVTLADTRKMKNIPDKTYRMSKQLKTLLAGINDSEHRSAIKKIMIDSELVTTQKPQKQADPKPE